MTTNPALAWPPLRVGLGPAMRREEVARRCGVGVSTVDQARRRTREGTARVAFPEPAGYGVPPGGTRPVSYWFERDVLAYGRDVGWLDARNEPVRKEPAAA